MIYSSKIVIHHDGRFIVREYADTIYRRNPIADDDDNVRKIDLFASSSDSKNTNKSENTRIEETNKEEKYTHPEYRSLIRTKRKVFDLVSDNSDHFITFITLTYADNMTEFSQAIKDLQNYTRNIKYKLKTVNEEYYYLAVPEFQKRGAVHFHILSSIPVNSALIPKRPTKRVRSEGKIIQIEYYDLPYWDKGYSQAFTIKGKDESFNLAKYMTKYITKDFCNETNYRLYSRQKILHSQNLRKPEVILTSTENISEILNTLCPEATKSKLWCFPSPQNGYCKEFKETTFTFQGIDEQQYYQEIIKAMIDKMDD